MTSIQSNRYYNNPQIGQAFGNLAQLFAPPSGSDLAGYATAKATREKGQYLADLIANPDDPTADRRATFLGAYNPTQSWQALDTNDATARRGQDIDASTSLEKQRLATEGELAKLYATPVTAAENSTVYVPGATADAAGLPRVLSGQTSASQGETIFRPDGSVLKGEDKPLSESEWQAIQSERLRGSGQLTDEMMVDRIMGERAPVEAVGADGKPVYISPGAAVREGAEPFVSKGSEAKPVNYQSPDGKRGTATTDGGGQLVDTQTRLPIAAGSVTFGTQIQGSEADTGMSTKTNLTAATSLEASLDAAEFRTNQMLDTLRKNPNVAGIPGKVKGFAQSIVSSAHQVANAYAEQAPEAIASLEELKSEIESVMRQGQYDPAVVSVASGIYDLAYARAQMSNPTGEVSRQAFDRALESFGTSFLSSQEDLATALQVFKDDTIAMGRVRVNSLRGQRPLNDHVTTEQGQQNYDKRQTGRRVEFDANGNRTR